MLKTVGSYTGILLFLPIFGVTLAVAFGVPLLDLRFQLPQLLFQGCFFIRIGRLLDARLEIPFAFLQSVDLLIHIFVGRPRSFAALLWLRGVCSIRRRRRFLLRLRSGSIRGVCCCVVLGSFRGKSLALV